MSLLIFQFVIKQWDKSQISILHQTQREAVADRYLISAKPAYHVLDKSCILEQYGDDNVTNVYKNGRIITSVLADGQIQFDRFQVCAHSAGDVLKFLSDEKAPEVIGSLNQGWIQSRYHWRYKVKHAGQIYWLYEEVVLNAVCLEVFSAEELRRDYFLTTQPAIIFIG